MQLKANMANTAIKDCSKNKLKQFMKKYVQKEIGGPPLNLFANTIIFQIIEIGRNFQILLFQQPLVFQIVKLYKQL